MARGPGHPFYDRLNELLAEAGFDRRFEERCRAYYAAQGRPGIPPGVYFRMLLIGYFEGLESQREIAWRCADSNSLKSFLGFGLTETTPDQSSLTNIRQRLPLEVHEEVFAFVLWIAQLKRLLKGQAVGVGATLLEANAALKSIVRKDIGEDYKQYLRRLAKEAGIEDPSDDDLKKFDQKRKGKKLSNDDWQSTTDPDGRIAKMKDGMTHIACKAEHAVDLDSELRRIRGRRGRRLQRPRRVLCERSFAHMCESGAGRRSWLRGLVNVAQRYVIHAAAYNLGVILRKL